MFYPTKKLVEVCDVVKSGIGFFDGEKEYVDTGSLLNGSVINSEIITYKKRPSRANMEAGDEDILVAKMKDTLKVYLATKEDEKKRIFSTGFFVFKRKPGLTISKYLFFYFLSPNFQDLKNSLSHGATQRAINNQDLEKYFEIPFPPIEEQRRIVVKIEKLFAKIEEAQKLREESKKSASALLQSAINEIFSGPKSKKWGEKTIEYLCIVQSGGTPSKAIASYWEDGDISWLRSESCKDEKISSAKLYITQKGLENSSAKILKPRTTLIALVGATIGKTGFLNFKSTTNQNIAGLYPKNKKELFPEFLFICARNLYPHFLNIGKGKFKMANLSFVKGLKIPLPPIEKQKKIVAHLDSLSERVRKLQDLQQKTADDFKNLKKSILSKAFKGELIK